MSASTTPSTQTSSPSDPQGTENPPRMRQIPIRLITVSDHANPRLQPDEEEDAELARSIAKDGLLNPVTVRPVGQLFELVAGSRRLAAVTALGSKVIAAHVVEMTDAAAADARFAENLQRRNLSPIEEASVLALAIESGSSTPEELARRSGRSREWVEARLELLTMPPSLQQAVHFGHVGLAAASWLGQMTSVEEIDRHVSMAVGHGISAATARLWLQQHQTHQAAVLATPPGEPVPPPPPVEFKVMVACAFCREDLEMKHTSQLRACGPCIDKLRGAQNGAA